MSLPSTRKTNPEGILKAGAVLTRSGKFQYLRSELGLSGDGVIEIDRTLDTLSHPTTLESLRDAPITIDHPSEGVTKDNFKQVVVGYVAGTPKIVGDLVVGDVIIGDNEAQLALEAGLKELSPGYDFNISEDNTKTEGPLRVNHLALVEKGRSGPGVKVLDREPLEELDMDAQEMKTAIKDAVTAALAEVTESSGKKKGLDYDTLGAAVSKALEPTTSKLDVLITASSEDKKARDEAAGEATRKKAKDDAETAAKAFEEQIRTEERTRYEVLTDVLPLIPEDKHDSLKTADVKTILVTAVGDSVPNAADMSEDFLRGVVLGMRKQQSGDDGKPGDLPPGVAPFVPSKDSDPESARKRAYDKYVDARRKAYEAGGGV